MRCPVCGFAALTLSVVGAPLGPHGTITLNAEYDLLPNYRYCPHCCKVFECLEA